MLETIKKCSYRNTTVQQHLECLQYDAGCENFRRDMTKVRGLKQMQKFLLRDSSDKDGCLKTKNKQANSLLNSSKLLLKPQPNRDTKFESFSISL